MKSEEQKQEDFEKFMTRYKPEFRDFEKIGEGTYANPLTSIAFDCWSHQLDEIDEQQKKIDAVKLKSDQIINVLNEKFQDISDQDKEIICDYINEIRELLK